MYYYVKFYSKGSAKPIDVGTIDLKSEIDKSDVIVIIATEMNYADLGFGFIEDVYGLFKGDNTILKLQKRRLNAIRSSIKNSPDWLHAVELKAKAKGISVDSMVTLDAMWMMKH
jgi:hypothetical protein